MPHIHKVWAVMDRVCEADILVAVFTTAQSAKEWVKKHKLDPYSKDGYGLKYESLDVEEVVLDPE